MILKLAVFHVSCVSELPVTRVCVCLCVRACVSVKQQMLACFRMCGAGEVAYNHRCKKKIKTPTNKQTGRGRSASPRSTPQLQLGAPCACLQDGWRQTEAEEVPNPQQPSLPQSDARGCWTPPGRSALFSRPINSRRAVPFVQRVHKEWAGPQMLQATRSLLCPASLICSSVIFHPRPSLPPCTPAPTPPRRPHLLFFLCCCFHESWKMNPSEGRWKCLLPRRTI